MQLSELKELADVTIRDITLRLQRDAGRTPVVARELSQILNYLHELERRQGLKGNVKKGG